MPKIAVYTIALNEEKHVQKWFESAKDADVLVIADTGSNDKTIERARKLGIKVHSIEVKPWRFDVARNASLALVPEDVDVCVQLDMDETLTTGWREKIENAWNSGNVWPIYRHVTSRYTDGSARTYQHYFKIHPRKDFIWKYPIHEIVVPKDGVQVRRELIDLEVDHHRDLSKPRNSYLELLELAVKEMPADWRMAHYLTREYWYKQDWQKVLITASTSLKILGGWDVERASTCMWASESASKLGYLDWAQEWAEKATNEAPTFYEAWHWHSHMCEINGEWQSCFNSASKILTLTRQDHHLVKPEVWEWWGYDLMALASHRLGNHDRAIDYGRRALAGLPNDERLNRNLNYYREWFQKNSSRAKQGQYLESSSVRFPIPEFPMGGSEILASELKEFTNYDQDIFNVIISRCDRSLIDKSRINILWQHLDSNQDQAQGMRDEGFVDDIDAFVFVSHYQYHSFKQRFKFPDSKCFVIHNAIKEIDFREKETSERVRIAYTSTPWRGLEVLLDSYEKLNREDCELVVYSSTAIYGRQFYEANDSHWKHLYEKAEATENVTYRGFVPHDILRQELFDIDILAYPSIWSETFCLSVAEAGSAGCQLLLSNLGALPEIAGDRARLVPFSDDKENLATRFAEAFEEMIAHSVPIHDSLARFDQHQHFKKRYSWSDRCREWNHLFSRLLTNRSRSEF